MRLFRIYLLAVLSCSVVTAQADVDKQFYKNGPWAWISRLGMDLDRLL